VTRRLHVVIRTPHGAQLDEEVRSVRVPTGTGQVGLRPGEEPLLLVVEPGLVVLHDEAGTRYAATAGGLLHLDREGCVLNTPFAAVGRDGDEVLGALDRELATPDGELVARRRLGELEQGILRALGERSPDRPRGAAHA
jgi:F0F1-type ATP synthase epsilon subunit